MKNKFNIPIETGNYIPSNYGHSIYKFIIMKRNKLSFHLRYYYDNNTDFKLYGFHIKKIT